MLRLALFLACILRAAAVEPPILTIHCGSVGDIAYVAGGASWLIPEALQPPGSTDVTLRFSYAPVNSFTYRLPVWNIPYVVTFGFMEPTVHNIGERVFSVRINNQLVFDRLDLVREAGYMTAFSRSVVAVGADTLLTIQFDSVVRGAVVSSIEVIPLSLYP